MEVSNEQVSKSHVITCNLKNRYFGSSIFFSISVHLLIQNIAVASGWLSNFLNLKFA